MSFSRCELRHWRGCAHHELVRSPEYLQVAHFEGKHSAVPDVSDSKSQFMVTNPMNNSQKGYRQSWGAWSKQKPSTKTQDYDHNGNEHCLQFSERLSSHVEQVSRETIPPLILGLIVWQPEFSFTICHASVI